MGFADTEHTVQNIRTHISDIFQGQLLSHNSDTCLTANSSSGNLQLLTLCLHVCVFMYVCVHTLPCEQENHSLHREMKCPKGSLNRPHPLVKCPSSASKKSLGGKMINCHLNKTKPHISESPTLETRPNSLRSKGEEEEFSAPSPSSSISERQPVS